jgi:hypothetical protein
MSPDDYADACARAQGYDSVSNAVFSIAVHHYADVLHARTARRSRRLNAGQMHRYTAAGTALTAWHNAYFAWNVSFDLGGTYWTRPSARSDVDLESAIAGIEMSLSHERSKTMSRRHRKQLRILTESLIQEMINKSPKDVYYDSERSRFASRRHQLVRRTRSLAAYVSILPDNLFGVITQFVEADRRTVRECME